MNGVDVGDLRGADDAIDAEITVAAGTFANANGFVGQLHVHRVHVRFRVDGDRPDIELFAGANDANRYFAAIRDQDLFKHEAADGVWRSDGQ